MIATNNYFNKVSEINFSELPEAFKKGHEFFARATNDGTSWESYQGSLTIKKTIDIYLAKLNEFVNHRKKSEKKERKATIKKQTANNKPIKLDTIVKQEVITTKSTSAPKPKKVAEQYQPQMVERMPEELRFVKRYIHLDGKTKTKDEILRFINSLQKAIVEKRIRKTSPYAEQVKYVQEKLIAVYNTMKGKIKLELKPETFEALRKLTGGEKVLASIGFIKRYIAMNGKSGMKEKAKQLLQQINRAMDKGGITDNDVYLVEIHELKKNLKAFITNSSIKTLEIEQATLNGLDGILGCNCQNLNGSDGKPGLMNSMAFANMQFKTLGFKGKWLELIGDPSKNFTAMVFGKPKMGKSYLCIELAGYLARNHGKVLYVAKEEGLDMTLQKKLREKDVAHPNLDVSSYLLPSLGAYDFIILDSVNRLGLQPEDLNRLKIQNPSKSFIFIFQTTKQGNFRGANSFQHDVDVVIEVPEKGKAVQMGRFNQGGEISIFNNYSQAA